VWAERWGVHPTVVRYQAGFVEGADG